VERKAKQELREEYLGTGTELLKIGIGSFFK
jgi:hypothetical protein